MKLKKWFLREYMCVCGGGGRRKGVDVTCVINVQSMQPTVS